MNIKYNDEEVLDVEENIHENEQEFTEGIPIEEGEASDDSSESADGAVGNPQSQPARTKNTIQSTFRLSKGKAVFNSAAFKPNPNNKGRAR